MVISLLKHYSTATNANSQFDILKYGLESVSPQVIIASIELLINCILGSDTHITEKEEIKPKMDIIFHLESIGIFHSFK